MTEIGSIGLVRELQHHAMDDNVPLITILRQALVVSKLYDEGSLDAWLELEISGYPADVEKPDYRKVRGTLKVNDQFEGLLPVRLPDEQWAKEVSTVRFHQGVEALTDLLRQSKGTLGFAIPPGAASVFTDRDSDITAVVVFILDSELVGVLSSIRQRVLNWALSLEARGIEGHGRSFNRLNTNEPAQVIHHVTNNNFESVTNSQIVGSSTGSVNIAVNPEFTQLLELLRETQTSVSALALSENDATVIREDLALAIAQAESTKPRKGILRESLKSVRNILEGASGNLVASGLLLRFGEIMKALGFAP